ncbi:hypothetical protein FVE85_1558 [Porphyridium purpureum]|uniref:BZIP domain-containing protein n=1 Tax=Porphyridium purpureum TaxID=35688 RepID=A0A5J4YXL5_PORPP|nr:hypothetical protein FVE85_1558 [Porphyridium purpureum]|eukprot:POR3609..scf209_3
MGATELNMSASDAASEIVKVKERVNQDAVQGNDKDRTRDRNRAKAARFRARKRAELESHISKYMTVQRENASLRAQILEMELRMTEMQHILENGRSSQKPEQQEQPQTAQSTPSSSHGSTTEYCMSEDLDFFMPEGTDWSTSDAMSRSDQMVNLGPEIPEDEAETEDEGDDVMGFWFGPR